MGPQFFNPGLRFFALNLVLIASFTMVDVTAQVSDKHPKHKSYAVIGAFTIENNANRLVELVRQFDMKASVQLNAHRDLYYVYINESYDQRSILSQVRSLRAEFTQFYDAWAYTGDFSKKEEVAVKLPEIKSRDLQTNASESSPASLKKETQGFVEERAEDVITPVLEKKEDHYYFYFNAINAKNFKEVKGNVNIIDPERAKHLKEAKSHKLVELRDPDNGTGRVKVATSMFGFREVQHMLDLDDPTSLQENPNVHLIGDSIVVDFSLERFKKGDVLIMYNVYFFKDAAIMKPESIYELNSLLDMLKENENLVVKIHGHTNGNSHGKIIHLDLEDKNFFGINGEHKESYGSAKKLSLYRSYTIQHWLMDQGIEEERMEIKGWGGKKMIYDKHSSQADQNVRVEIEILEE